MLKLLFIITISLLFQACQVEEQATSSKMRGGQQFPGSTFTAVLPNDGWKKLGDNLDITLLFPLPVTVTGMPFIEAQVGYTIRRFYFVSGNNSESLVFRYTVTSSDLDTNGIEIGDEVVLNGGSLKYRSQEAVLDDVPTAFNVPDHIIRVDGIVPMFVQTVAPLSGNLATGQLLSYSLQFNEKVVVTGVPYFNVTLTSGTVAANYRNGSGSTTLQFARTLAVTDTDADGFSNSTLLNMLPSSGIKISDEAGNVVSSSIGSVASTGTFININQPAISGVSVPAAATYTLGQNLDFTVTFTEAVTVTGAPSLPILINTGNVNAYYVSGSGTTTLLFRYTVGLNQVDSDGITLVSPMSLNSGTIKNSAGTQNAALIYSVPATAGRLVDAATGPYVMSGSAPNSGNYIEGQLFTFMLNFNKSVTVTGTPRLPIIIGTTTVYADYVSGTGSSTLTFTYTTTTSDQDTDGISLLGPIDLNGGSIVDSGSVAAILAFTPPSTMGITVDGSTPTISGVAAQTTGAFTLGQPVNFNVVFSEPVNVIGSPTLDFDLGGAPKQANYITGSGTNTLTFRYVIQSGDNDIDGLDVNTISLNAGTIRDGSNHNANLTFVPFTAGSITVDADGPTIALITPPTDGSYKIGDVLEFSVDWSEATYISGTPRLALTVGTQTLYANYVSNASNTLTSVFRYTVLTSHLDANGIATAGLQLNSGTIKDASGNNANLTFVAPNLTNVFVDGVIPSVATLTPPANMTYKAGQSIDFTLTWTENITFTGVPSLTLIIGSTTVAANLSAVGANWGTFSYTVISGQLDVDGINLLAAVALGGGVTIRDAAGNDSYLQINPPSLINVKVDAVLPTIAAVVPPADDTYKRFDYLEFEVIWTEPVLITGTPRIQMTVGASTFYATYYGYGSNANSTIFRYQVGSTDQDTDGVSIFSPVQLNGGTIRDLATNDATLTFTLPVLTGVKVDGIVANINPITPVTYPAIGSYNLASNMDFVVNWTENVDVDTSGGVPYLLLYVGSSYKTASYVSGSGTTALTFRYSPGAGDLDTNGVQLFRTYVYLNGGTIKDAALNDAIPYTTTLSWATITGVNVDAVAPTVTSANSSNLSSPSNPNSFKPGHTIQYNLTLNENVTVTGTPRIIMTIGGLTRYANYHSGTGTSTLTFRFTMDTGETLLDLDGISINTTIDMNGGTIRDASLNSLTTAIPFSDRDYVHYSAIVARYHIYGNDYASSSCGMNFCATNVYDISGSGNHMVPTTSSGPVVTTGFGTNSTGYMQFNNLTAMRTLGSVNVKRTLLAMKTVPNPSNSGTTSTHIVLNRRYQVFTWPSYSYYYDQSIRHASNSSTKSILMSPAQRLKINNGSFSAGYVSSESTPGLWAADTSFIYTHDYASMVNYYVGSEIGSSSFNGQIAEVIMLNDSTAITDSHLDNIRDQLNAIHGVY